jgi:hypothetical protein
MQRLSLLALLGAVALATMGDDCGGPPTSEQIQNKNQELVNRKAVESVGMPNIRNFAEKRQLKEIYELRDQAITTYTYTQDRNGVLHFFCNSVGFGVPYSTEYSNPQQVEQHSEGNGGNIAIGQAEPNGLYSPASAEGTWVFCLDPKTNRNWPIYVEPRVIVSPFELTSPYGVAHTK